MQRISFERWKYDQAAENFGTCPKKRRRTIFLFIHFIEIVWQVLHSTVLVSSVLHVTPFPVRIVYQEKNVKNVHTKKRQIYVKK